MSGFLSKSWLIRVVFHGLLILVIAGCSGTPKAEVFPPTSVATDAPLSTGPTLTRGPFIAPTQIPTQTPTINPRITPTLTFTPVPTSTPRAVIPFTYLKLEPETQSAKIFQRVEMTIATDGQAGNPFDASQVDLLVTFTSGSGKTVRVPAFYYQEYDRQTLEPVGFPAWKVRFTPTEVGEWTAQAELTLQNLKSELVRFQISADPSARGFVRLNRQYSTYFQYDNGDFYLPIGVNMGWSTQDVLADYERWLDRFSQNGGNLVRIWMASWSFGLEWNDTGLGDYTERLKQAWLLDQVFEMAEARGVTIMLCLLNHGAFSATTNPEWENNPYNALLGGPLQSPEQFVTDPTARDLFKRRLRYIASRWGYSTSLFAWEWWNEIHWTPITTDALRPWITEMTAYLSTLDPYDHLVTHSTSNSDTIWDAPELDLAQVHDYSPQFVPSSWPYFLEQDWRVAPGKPVLMGEFGMDAAGEQQTGIFSRQPIHLHNGLWTAPFLGFAGTGMYWWWDSYIDPLNLWGQFKPVSMFLAGVNLGEYQPEKVASEPSGATALLLKKTDHAMLWVVNNTYNVVDARKAHDDDVRYKNKGNEIPDWIYQPDTLKNIMVKVTGLKDGTYQAYFFDTNLGTWTGSTQVVSQQGTLTLTIGELSTDLAVKILPKSEPAPTN